MRRLAVLSLHTSPLAQPGTGDGGGMNVYVRELTAALARTGVACDVFTRAWSAELPEVVDVEPGLRVHHVPAGPLRCIPKESLPSVVDEFTARVLERMAAATESGDDPGGGLPYTSVHANYWLSGLSGHVIKHELNLPLVCTFHTLDRVKAGLHARGGRGRHAAPSGRGRGVDHRVLRRGAGLVHGRGRADRLALRRRTGEDPHRAAGRRPRLLRPGPPAPGPPGARVCRSTGGCCSSWGGSSRSSAPTWPSRPWPSCSRRAASRTASSWWAVRAGPTARSRSRACTTWPTPGACASRSTSSSRSHTSCCRRTTGPPTSASSRAAPSRSGWWPWRRPPAGRRSSPRRWAG